MRQYNIREQKNYTIVCENNNILFLNSHEEPTDYDDFQEEINVAYKKYIISKSLKEKLCE